MVEAAYTQVARFALFPLGVVLFPGGLLPLRIFEPRYLRMVSECLKADKPFVVTAILDGPEAGGVATTARTGTLARIVDWSQGDDGLLHLVCQGEHRCRIDRVDVESDQLLQGDVSLLAPAMERPLPEDLQWLAELLEEVLEKLGEPFDQRRVPDPGAGHVSARLTELLPLPMAEKLALFEIDDVEERLRRMAGLLQAG